ncbi:MAG: 5-formyltetrahydrofolate cyclo-ligase [Brevinematales bacterium]|nr:5-formyltetrahydrofolate cyclo-ligase [Brevinematales bacterium]
MNINEKKELLRKEFLGKRLSLSREEVEKRSASIVKNIEKSGSLNNDVFLFYVPIKNEVDLLPLAKELFLKGKTILFPRIIDYERIVPYIIEDINFDFIKGAFGIPEPNTVPFYCEIDVIFVPGIVFGRNGYRIGYGKSYYDVFLSSFPYKKTVGVAFDFQLIDNVPFNENDVRLNFLISESEILTF